MSIFGFSSVTESAININNTYVGEVGEASEICHESALELSKVSSSLLVADIMIESKGVYENANVEVLTEGVIRDTYDKLIEIFKKFWEKLKKWFNAIRRALESYFMPIVKFVKKYENELTGKDYGSFEYNGHKWHADVFDAEKQCEFMAEAVEQRTDKTSLDEVLKVYSFTKADKSVAISSDAAEEYKKDVLALLAPGSKKPKNLSELKEYLTDHLTGGDKTTIDKFSVKGPSEMCRYILDYKSLIKGLNRTEKDVQKSINDTVKAIEDTKKNLDSDEKTKYAPLMTKHSEIVRFATTAMLGCIEVLISCTKKVYSEFGGALRSFLRYNPAKEGYGYMENNGSSSILESAFGLV